MNDPNVILINTPYYDQYGENNPELDPKMPLGLLYLASTLIQHKVPVRIIDANMEKMRLHEIITNIKHNPCNVLGMNVLASNIDTVLSIATSVRQILPNTIIILGGIQASVAYAEILLNCSSVDVCVLGEGELTMIDLLTLEKLEDVKGIAFRGKNGEIITTPPQNRILNLDRLPFPSWELLPIRKYLNHGRMNIMASRGCSNNCTYCTSRNLWHSRMSWRTPCNVISEMMECYTRFGVTEFHFLDDNFLFWPRLDDFIIAVIDKKFKWRCIGRIEAISETLASNLGKAGCDSITFGIETGNPRLQKAIDKNLNLDAVPTAIEACAKAGIAVKSYFMLGFPTETLEEMNATIKFAKDLRRNGLKDVMFLPVIPYRGTKLFEQVLNEKGNHPNLGRISIRAQSNSYGLSGQALRNFNKCAYYPTISASLNTTGEELVSYIANAYKSFYEC